MQRAAAARRRALEAAEKGDAQAEELMRIAQMREAEALKEAQEAKDAQVEYARELAEAEEADEHLDAADAAAKHAEVKRA